MRTRGRPQWDISGGSRCLEEDSPTLRFFRASSESPFALCASLFTGTLGPALFYELRAVALRLFSERRGNGPIRAGGAHTAPALFTQARILYARRQSPAWALVCEVSCQPGGNALDAVGE
eukprot:5305941-Prymnesium_polylepis.1